MFISSFITANRVSNKDEQKPINRSDTLQRRSTTMAQATQTTRLYQINAPDPINPPNKARKSTDIDHTIASKCSKHRKANRKIQHSARITPMQAQKTRKCSKTDGIWSNRNRQHVSQTYREGIDLLFLEGVGIAATHEEETGYEWMWGITAEGKELPEEVEEVTVLTVMVNSGGNPIRNSGLVDLN